MSSLDISDEEVPATEVAEEPNITTTVEDVPEASETTEEPAEPEVAEPVASETAEEPDVAEPEVAEPEVEPEVVEPEVVEPEVVEPEVEPVASETVEEVVSSENDLENRVKELEEKLNKFIDVFKSVEDLVNIDTNGSIRKIINSICN